MARMTEKDLARYEEGVAKIENGMKESSTDFDFLHDAIAALAGDVRALVAELRKRK